MTSNPVSLRIALRQRIRWAKGHLQAFAETGWPLWKHVFTSHDAPTAFMSYDMFLLVCPARCGASSPTPPGCCAPLRYGCSQRESFGVVGAALLAWAAGFGKRWLRNAVIALYVFLTERQHMPALPWYRKLWFAVTFPLFDVIGRISTVIALFSHVDWKPIPHDCAAGIDEMRQQKQPSRNETAVLLFRFLTGHYCFFTLQTKFQLSRHISATVFSAFHPRMVSALCVSAHIWGRSPSRRGPMT